MKKYASGNIVSNDSETSASLQKDSNGAVSSVTVQKVQSTE